jgi:hypothetical protein
MAMIMALVVIVILGTVMAYSLAMTMLTSKKTNDLYLYEQSTLLAKSATEYALLLVAGNVPCSNIDTNLLHFTQDSIYTIDIGIEYIYYNDPSTATNEAEDLCSANGGVLYTSVITPEQNGSALIDVSVSVTDGNISAEPIHYFRRTIQKL